MMTPEELLHSMRAALADEREGIRRLDRGAIARATAAKEDVLKTLQQSMPADRKALALALEQLKGELRSNLVLLAHARDCTREALTLCTTNGGRGRLEAKL